MEKELFRENLARLDAKFPDTEFLSMKEIAKYTGLSINSARKVFSPLKKDGFISKARIASHLS